MFTGIIQSTGIIENINYENNIYIIKTMLGMNDCQIGSSVSCDGVCLTAKSIKEINSEYFFEVNIGEETIKRSNLSNWKVGEVINIEKSLRVGDEIAGHFVYGHVDSVIDLIGINKLRNSWEFEFSFVNSNKDINFTKYIVEKGSVAINGVSLTVANVLVSSFNVSVIPHTYATTNFSNFIEGSKVNIEFDPLARYISSRYGK
jgi:riboflavin synthase